MGITGTDVSKDAADTVLLDDNFATIVGAVEEGRIIYDNIRKFLKYTMTSNTGEILVMLLAPLLGMPLPLVPLQILWINLVTDGLPGLALAVEPGERDTMQRPPRAPDQPVFDRAMITDIGWIGLVMGALSLGVGYSYWRSNPTTVYDSSWGTIVFTVLTLSQIGNAVAMRSTRDSIFRTGLLSNRAMLASVALTFVLQLAVVYTPFLQRTFRTTALSLGELAMCVVLSTTVFWAVEAHKWFQRVRRTTGV
jgi:Ca2+-transporting ATPase